MSDFNTYTDKLKVQNRALLAFMTAEPADVAEKDYGAEILKAVNTKWPADAPIREDQLVVALPYDRSQSPLLYTDVDSEDLRTEMNGTATHRLMPDDMKETLMRFGVTKADAMPITIPAKQHNVPEAEQRPAVAVLVAGGEARKRLAIKALTLLAHAEDASQALGIKPSEYREQLEDKDSPVQGMIAAILRNGGFKQGDKQLDEFISTLGADKGKYTNFIISVRMEEKKLPQGEKKDGPKNMLDHAQKGRGEAGPSR